MGGQASTPCRPTRDEEVIDDLVNESADASTSVSGSTERSRISVRTRSRHVRSNPLIPKTSRETPLVARLRSSRLAGPENPAAQKLGRCANDRQPLIGDGRCDEFGSVFDPEWLRNDLRRHRQQRRLSIYYQRWSQPSRAQRPSLERDHKITNSGLTSWTWTVTTAFRLFSAAGFAVDLSSSGCPEPEPCCTRVRRTARQQKGSRGRSDQTHRSH